MFFKKVHPNYKYLLQKVWFNTTPTPTLKKPNKMKKNCFTTKISLCEAKDSKNMRITQNVWFK